MGKMKWLPWTGLALAAMASPVFGQQEITVQNTPQEEVVIIKKILDDKGIETIEQIEVVDKMSSDRIQALEKALDKVAEIENLDIDIELSDISTMEKKEDLIFMYKEANNEERPFLGVTIETHEAGVKITAVTTGSAAETAGLKSGDVIKEIQGKSVTSTEELQAAIRNHKVGETVKVAYLRDDSPAYADATLKAKSSDTFIVRSRSDNNHRRHSGNGYANHHVYQASKSLEDPCKRLEELNGMPFIGIFVNTSTNKGAGINSVIENTGASRSRLQTGDVITRLDGDVVSDYHSLEAAKKKHKPGDVVRITYLRGDKKGTTRLTIGSLADRETREVRMLEELCDEVPAETKSDEPAKVENKMPQITSGTSLDVFPNPAQDIVTLQFDGAANAQTTISVLSIEGKEVMRREINENTEQFTEQIDLSKLPAGMYIVTVKQGDTVISKQVALKSN